MTKVILDASAFLALINNEEGADLVEELLPNAIMSAVNVAEVVAELSYKMQMTQEDINLSLSLIPEIIDYDKTLAIMSGSLKALTAEYGLSLGDRACLALGEKMLLPVYTADKIWAKLKINTEIHLIR